MKLFGKYRTLKKNRKGGEWIDWYYIFLSRSLARSISISANVFCMCLCLDVCVRVIVLWTRAYISDWNAWNPWNNITGYKSFLLKFFEKKVLLIISLKFNVLLALNFVNSSISVVNKIHYHFGFYLLFEIHMLRGNGMLTLTFLIRIVYKLNGLYWLWCGSI